MDPVREALEKLKQDGQANMDALIQELKEDEAALREESGGCSDNPTGVIQALGVDNVLKLVAGKVDAMEETFLKLKGEGRNNVDCIIGIMKDCTPRLIDGIQMTEEKARKFFEDPENLEVEITKFKEVMTKVASEHKKSVEEVVKTLNETKIVEAMKAGYNAFKDTMNK